MSLLNPASRNAATARCRRCLPNGIDITFEAERRKPPGCDSAAVARDVTGSRRAGTLFRFQVFAIGRRRR
jgi:hypothetical protein